MSSHRPPSGVPLIRRHAREPHTRCPSPSSPTELIPNHWQSTFKVQEPFATIFKNLFKTLCLIALGRSDLNKVWSDTRNPDEKVWIEGKDRLSERIQVVTFIASFLLSTTAAFVTTTPPVVSMLNYNEFGPYVCLLLSFGLTLGGLVVGCAVVYVMGQCTADWYQNTLMSSRSRVCCTLFLIAYPWFCIGVSTTIIAFGFLAAAWKSSSGLVRHGSTFVLLIPVILIPLFLWTQISQRALWTYSQLHRRLWRNSTDSTSTGSLTAGRDRLLSDDILNDPAEMRQQGNVLATGTHTTEGSM